MPLRPHGAAALMLFLFVLFAICAGYAYFRYQVVGAKREAAEQLSLIADFKAVQITGWYNARMGQTRYFYQSKKMSHLAEEYFKNPSPSTRDMILSSMVAAQENFHFTRVLFIDKDGQVCFATPADRNWLGPKAKKTVLETLKSGKIAVNDLHTSKMMPGTVDMDIFIPLGPAVNGPGMTRKPVGVLMFEINPHEFLYPLIQAWPVPSRTGETLLVRREGDNVVYLNELRHKKNTALSLQLPIRPNTVLPAALAVLGKKGVLEGVDYRGAPVVAVTQGIEGTPWFLVAKVDRDEIFSPLRKEAFTTGTVVFVLILSAALALVLIRRSHDIAEGRRNEKRMSAINIDLERRVEERTKQLEAANKELEAFSYSVSHDLRAPLRGIDGFSLALIEDCGHLLDDKGRHYLERVRTAAQRMGLLIDDLLDLSRVTRSIMNPSEVDLTTIVKKIAGDLQENAVGRQVEWAIAADVRVHGDERLLEVAVRNLLDNAFKFTSRQPSARIEFGAFAEDGQETYFVRDNGAGFDPDYTGKLFGVFQRLHSLEEFEGTGIGLATVKRIIDRHGGRIWADGSVNGGAVFYFTLG